MPLQIPLPAQLLRRPFTLEEARGLGVSPDVLRPPRFASPHRGVRVPASVEPSLIVDAIAAGLALPPSAVLVGWTALRLLELPTPFGEPEPGGRTVAARVPAGLHRPQVAGIHCTWLRTHDLVHLLAGAGVDPLLAPGVRALRVQHPLSAWCDVAPGLPWVDAVALGDAVRRRWADEEQMRAAVDARRGRRGTQRLQRVLAAVRYQVDSAAESDTRLLMVAAGLPEPLCGRWVRDATGRLWQVDLLWPDHRVVVEYDGDVHRTKGKSQWRLDESKRQLLREAGWTVVVVNGDDLSRTVPGAREQTVGRVRRALAENR